MSQNTNYNLANQSGSDFRAELNNNLLDIVSNNSGASEPSTMFAYELWADTTNSLMKIRNSGNSAWITLPFSITADNTVDINGGTVNGISSLSFSSGATVASILDEDNLSTDSATALATQQSIKAYVDSQVTAQDLDISDGSSSISIDLDSETLILAGGTGLTSSAGTNTVTFAIDSTVTTLTGSQTLTNKTLTTPIISSISNTGTVTLPTSTDTLVGKATTDTLTNKSIDLDNNTISNVEVDNFKASAIVIESEGIGSNDNDTTLPTSAAVKDYVDTKVTAEDLDISDGSSSIAIDLDSETLSLLGGTGVTAAASGNGVTFTIGQAVGTSDNVVFNQVTAALVGNASTSTTAAALTTARAIALAGDVVGTVNFDGSAGVSISTTIQANSVALGTDTTGDYVGTVTGGTGIDSSGATSGEGIAHTLSLDLNELTTETTIADADFIAMVDATDSASGKITFENLEDAIFSSVSGDITISESGVASIAANSVVLGTDTTGNYVATIADAGNSRITVANSGSESAAITLDITDDAIGSDQIANNAVALGTQSTGNYVATIAGTTNEIEVSGSGSETSAVTVGLPDDVTIAGNLTVNGTTTTVNTDTLAVKDPLIKLATDNAGADSVDIGFYGLYDTSGSQDLYAGLFRDANDSGKFKLFKDLQAEPTTTVNTSGTGYAGGTLVATFEGNITGNVTGQVSTLSNHDTDDLSEGSSNLYHTTARSRSAISASGDIAYNSSTGVISFTASAAPVTSVNSATGAVVLTSANIAENTNLYYTDTRVATKIDAYVDKSFIDNLSVVAASATGNAGSATILETARTIAGVSFNGSANISLNTSNITEDSGYLYYTDARANSAIDARVTNTFINNLTGVVADTATILATARTIGGTSFDGSANIVPGTITVADTTDTSSYVALFESATGDLAPKTDAAITYNAGTGALTSTSFVGALTGNVTGNTSGTAATVTGAAQTNITSLGTLTTLTVDDVIINGATIGHTGDTDLLTLASGILTVAGEVSMTTLDIGGTNVTSTAAELNILDGVTSTAAELNILDRVTSTTAEITIFDGVTSTATEINLLDALDRGSILYGNASGVTAVLGQGTADQVLTSDGTDISWADAAGGGATSIDGLSDAKSAGTNFANSLLLGHETTGTLSSASNNVGVGIGAMDAITSGTDSVFVGFNAGSSFTSGNESVGIGSQALLTATTAEDNIAIGCKALKSATTGGQNMAMGLLAGEDITTGYQNILFGYLCGMNITTGINNIAIGGNALDVCTTASENLAIGRDSLGLSTSGTNNVAVGNYTGDAITTGHSNTMLGIYAGSAITEGDYNVAIGRNALDACTTAENNVAVGWTSLGSCTTGASNTGVGGDVLAACTTGTLNSAFGTGSSDAITTAERNSAFGIQSLGATTSGGYNSSFGERALAANTTATQNSAFGSEAFGSSTTATAGVAIGFQAGQEVTTGSYNVIIGHDAGNGITTGPSNVLIGASVADGGTTIEKCVMIGRLATQSATNSDSQIVIGYGATGKGDSTGFISPSGGAVYQGNNATAWAQTSDRRIKKNIVDNNVGLDVINQIRVRNFEYRTLDEIVDFDNPKSAVVEQEGIQLGAIAQELEEFLPEVVETTSEGVKSVTADRITWHLVNAIQELTTQVETLKSQVETLKGE